jgi:hypothetical protein
MIQQVTAAGLLQTGVRQMVVQLRHRLYALSRIAPRCNRSVGLHSAIDPSARHCIILVGLPGHVECGMRSGMRDTRAHPSMLCFEMNRAQDSLFVMILFVVTGRCYG